jgi:hypothetical protein
MKDIRGWIALAISVVSCFVIGSNGLLLKKLNLSVLILLGISIVIVFTLKGRNKQEE